MMMRTYLDESSLYFGTADPPEIRDAIFDLVDVMEEVRDHEDECLLWSHDYEIKVQTDTTLCDFLFPERVLRTDELRDARLRLIGALDRTPSWSTGDWELEVSDYEVVLDSGTVFAPSLAQAVAAAKVEGSAAALALSTARRAGAFFARVGEETATLYAVTAPIDRRHFIRASLVNSPPRPAELSGYIQRAFPTLEWLNGARQGLRVNSKFFFGDRFETMITHLSALNDEGARLFATQSQPKDREQGLPGVNLSSEGPNTKSKPNARQERTSMWEGKETVFWWHTKIRPTEGRIHFHHDPVPKPEAPHGRIVIGFCVEHFST